jgi:ABC-2 type transport system permease protein
MAFGLRWAGTGVFCATEVRVQFHEWLAILTGTLVQAVLLVFVWVLAPPILPIALVGALVYSVFLIGQRVLNEAAYVRIDHKLNELYHASPMSPEAYFLGMSSGMFIAYLPPILVIAVIAVFVYPFGPLAWGVLALSMLAVWAVSSTLGYFISTLFKDMKTIWPYSSLITNLMGIVPPVFYPLGLVPAGWRWLALVLPTSSAAALVNGAAGLETLSNGDFLLASGSLAVEAIAMLFFGLYWARRTAREA